MDIRGEYWIQDGYVEFADGDIGDKNHEAIAIEAVYGNYQDAIQSLAEKMKMQVNLHSYYDGPDCEEIQKVLNMIHEKLLRKMNDDQAHNYIMKQLGCDKEAYKILLDSGDARFYAITHMGWIAIRSNNIEIYGYTKDRQKEIANAIRDIFDNEGYEEDENLEETEFSIYDYKSGKSWYVSLADLEQPEVVARLAQRPTTSYNKSFTAWLKDPEENKYQQSSKSRINPWNVAAQKAGIGSELWRGTSESLEFKNWLEQNYENI
jgi:hypothetical protein